METVLGWLAGYVVPALITILTPLVLAGIKKAIAALDARLPKAAYPTVAPVLGALLEIVAGMHSLPGLPPGVGGAILGAVGTWLREFYDQWRRHIDPDYSAKVAM